MKRVEMLAAEPEGLKAYRAQLQQEGRTPNYNSFRNEAPEAYQELRCALTSAQQGLCAYCEINIHDTSPAQVEHFLPKSQGSHGSSDPQRHLDYLNHLACCMGGTERTTLSASARISAVDDDYYRPDRAASQSCGSAKGDREPGDEVIDPRSLQLQHKIVAVFPDGTIHPDKPGCTAAELSADRVRSTIGVLKLDCYRLTYARRKWWKSLQRTLPVDRISRPEIAQRVFAEYLAPNSEGWLQRFFSTTRCYLQPFGVETWLAQQGSVSRSVSDGQ